MYTDAQLRLSAAQPITAAGTVVSTNTNDLLSANKNIGRGRLCRVRVQTDVAFVGGTNLIVQYIQSALPDLSSPDVLATGPTFLTAALVAGAVLMDSGVPSNTKRYTGFQYISTGVFTAGTVSAFILVDTDFNPLLPANTGF